MYIVGTNATKPVGKNRSIAQIWHFLPRYGYLAYFTQKHILWILIRSGASNEFPQHVLMEK